MAELQRLLKQNGAFQSELIRNFLAAAQSSLREQQRQDGANGNQGSDNTSTQFINNQLQNTDSADRLNENFPDNYRPNNDDNEVARKSPTGSESGPVPSSDTSPDSLTSGASPLILPDNVTSGRLSPGGLTPEMMKLMMSSPDSGLTDNGNEESPEQDPNANLIDVERVLEEVRQVPSDLRQKLLEQVVASVGEAHLQTCSLTYDKVAEANARHGQQKQRGAMPDISKLSIKPHNIWQMFVQNMLPEITQVVKFCKKLPGFSELCPSDQMTLIKKGSFETLVCRICMIVDPEKNEMFTPDMKMKCSRAMIKAMPMGSFLEELFVVAKMFNPLALQENEIGLFTAVLLLCPDRPGLVNKKLVEKLNVLYSQSLYGTMKQNHADHEEKFKRLVSLITMFRRINSQHSVALNNMKMQAPDMMQSLPPLHREVYDVSQ